MKQIPLSQGLFATIDNGDAHLVLPFKWHAKKSYRTAYAFRWLLGKDRSQPMHTLLLPSAAGFQIDHINGNGLDNRRSNLRIATQAENNRNRGKFSSGTSKFIGVNWNQEKQKWQCRIRVNGHDVHLGWFADELEAAQHYDFAAIQCVGPFARLNFGRAA